MQIASPAQSALVIGDFTLHTSQLISSVPQLTTFRDSMSFLCLTLLPHA